MSPVHHPSEAVLADYASGALADGPSLVVSAHLERCAHCRQGVKLLEAVGGALLDEVAPAEMQDDALALALARIERPAPKPAPIPRRPGPGGLVLPRALASRRIGARRFVAPGTWVAPVLSRNPGGWRTYLLRAPSGVAVPHHGHNGDEYTVLLQGAFADRSVHYQTGDFAEADPGTQHHPHAEGPDACVCLISGQRGIKADGILRLIQPLLGV